MRTESLHLPKAFLTNNVWFCLFVFFLAKSHHLVKMNNLQFFWLSYFGFYSFKFGQLEDI